MATISASNSTFMLSILALFPIPQQIQGYSTDEAFASEAVEMAEVMKGVDGKMSFGFTPFITPMTVALQADSASNAIFDAWIAAMKAAKEVLPANGIISLPAIKSNYILTNGVLRMGPPFPATRKVLQPRTFTIAWDDISVIAV